MQIYDKMIKIPININSILIKGGLIYQVDNKMAKHLINRELYGDCSISRY